MNELWAFIEATCKKYNIDESHGLKHAMATVAWAEKLMAPHNDIGKDEHNMIIYAAALHDMCDSKYRNIADATDEICAWLKTQGWSEIMTNSLIAIITSMSYTKLKNKQVPGPIVYPEHGSMQRAYHIVRHADLLEGYRVVRCYLYTIRRKPDWSEDDKWAETQKIFDERIFKYVSDGWIFLEVALQYVPDLEREARRCLKERDTTYII